MVFSSTNFGLDLFGVVGSIYWTASLYNLQPALKGWSGKGAPAGSSMSKSISFLLKGKNSTVDDVMIAYLFLWWNGSVFIKGNSGHFPCQMVI